LANRGREQAIGQPKALLCYEVAGSTDGLTNIQFNCTNSRQHQDESKEREGENASKEKVEGDVQSDQFARLMKSSSFALLFRLNLISSFTV
jgi:hypothetical protein